MDKKEQEFLKRLRETFRLEAEEHIRGLSSGLIDLEKAKGSPGEAPIVETVFREAHSLKGAARSVNLREIEALCQPLESALAAVKRGEIEVSAPLFDLFHQAVDGLGGLVSTMETELDSVQRAAMRELGRRLNEAAKGAAAVPVDPKDPLEGGGSPSGGSDTPPAGQEKKPGTNPGAEAAAPKTVSPVTPEKPFSPPSAAAGASGASPDSETASTEPPAVEARAFTTSETVRIPISKLEPLVLQAEGMIQAKLAGAQRTAELREIQQALSAWKTDWVKWRAQRPSQATEMPEWVTARLDALTGTVTTISALQEQDQRALRHMVDDHLEGMKQVLMLPVSTLVEGFPRLVRDLGRDQGKDVELVMRGTEIEIDRRILEDLKDPLIHMVRNCVDHGVEKPTERLRNGKAERANITLSFNARDGRQVEILVADDGAGIDLQAVQAAAVRAGMLNSSDAEKLDPHESLGFIFQSGISTSGIITDISGRGVGLAIVREKVENLGGSVSVDTQPGVGTTFRLLLPLRRATFRGVRVRAGQQVFVVPSAHVERALRVSPEEIQTVENRETIGLDGQILPLVRLGDVLQLPQHNSEGRQGQRFTRGGARAEEALAQRVAVLVLVSAEQRIAVAVDEVFGEEEVLVKGLGAQLRRVRNIAGATVLGTGTVVPVLNIADLLDSAVRPGAALGSRAGVEKDSERVGRLLVAEDSITARTLLKNILETGGYQVTTAVDGADAFTQLRSGEFDLVVSDVDMPRMSGFELTTKIRADKKLGELPVVLVTALESRPDRERGIEVGANAYIIKSSFDQSNLLDVIHRLL